MNILTVSVVIPVYNRAESVMLSLASVLKQTFHDFEVIVVDDCSTDHTQKVLNSCTDIRVKYVRHDLNKGGGAARNTGIRLSRGRYIAFLDSDDTWEPDKLACQVQKMDQLNMQWGGIYTGRIDVINSRRSIAVPKREGMFITDVLLGRVTMASGSTLMIRRECIEKAGFFDESLSRFQDLDFLLRLFSFYDVAVIEKPLAIINRYYKSNFTNIERDSLHFIKKIHEHNNLLRMDKNTLNKVISFRYLQLAKNLMQGCGSMFLALKYFFKAVILDPGKSIRDYISFAVIFFYRIFRVDLRNYMSSKKDV